MTGAELVNNLGKRVEDVADTAFPVADKLEVLNIAQKTVVNMLHNGYLQELETIVNNKVAGAGARWSTCTYSTAFSSAVPIRNGITAIFDETNDEIPLMNQMLKFWQFKDDEMIDTTPDFYITDEESEWFRKFHDFQINEYGYISASSTFGDTAEPDVMLDKIKEHDEDMVWYYYGEVPLSESHFNFLKNVIEVKPLDLTIRQQQILKINAIVNYGNETGMNLWTAKYSKTYILNNKTYGPIHGSSRERKKPFKSGNFVKGVTYL